MVYSNRLVYITVVVERFQTSVPVQQERWEEEEEENQEEEEEEEEEEEMQAEEEQWEEVLIIHLNWDYRIFRQTHILFSLFQWVSKFLGRDQ